VWAIRGAIVLGLAVLIASAVDKTLWDWLKLLVVPFVLALGGYLFTRSENQRRDRNAEDQRKLDREIADQRTNEDRKIAQKRAETERQIADQRSQDDTLQAYLEQMGPLFLNRAPHEDGESDKVRTIVRARTLTVLKVLDAEHNRSVLQFVIESELLNVSDFKGADLEGADLRGANLIRLDLSKANLKAANLSEAKLWKTNLEQGDLRDAKLNNAELTEANLRSAELENADLRYAYLKDTVLFTAKLRKANLRHANLSGADLGAAELEEADLSHADLRPTHLRVGETLKDTEQVRWERSISGVDIEYERSQHHFLQAELSFAKLAQANLSHADLRYANLYESDLTDQHLSGANLQGATTRVRAVVANILDKEPADEDERVIREDLKLLPSGSPRPMRSLVPIEKLQQARSLEGATMPNGQKYEDWLNDREALGEDAENSSPS